MDHSPLTRRSVIAGAVGTTLALAACAEEARAGAAPVAGASERVITKGRIKQSVVGWCFNRVGVKTPELARAAAAMGYRSIELGGTEHWPLLKQLGLTCAIAGSHGFVEGLNHLEHHAMCEEKIGKAVEAAAAFGCPSVICFSGMRKGLSDEEGIANCVTGIKRVIGLAEAKGVTLCMEVLNSRVAIEMKGHPDYHADRIEFAAEVCRRVGSPRMKILFDIYHTQIMQGDVISRIHQFKEWIGHYHTAGVPGRGEIDDTQELNYPPIMRAILETGYTGYVAQEFIPTWKDPFASLRHAGRVCDV
jgi:hydroxypyruvate isomerase